MMGSEQKGRWLLRGAGALFLLVPILYTHLYALNNEFLEWNRKGWLAAASLLVLGAGALVRAPSAGRAWRLAGAIVLFVGLTGLRNPRFDLVLLEMGALLALPAALLLADAAGKLERTLLQAALCLQALYGILQVLAPGSDPAGLAILQSARGGGFLGNANLAAAVLGGALVAFPAPWSGQASNGEGGTRFQRTWPWICFVLWLAGLVATKTLWAWVVFVPVAALTWWRPVLVRRVNAAWWVAAGILIAALFGMPGSPAARWATHAGSGGDPFVRGRSFLWTLTWREVISERPVFGVGPGAFREHMMGAADRVNPDDIPAGVHDLGMRGHNDGLEWLAEFGGALLPLWLLGWAWWFRRNPAAAPAAAWLGLLGWAHFPLHSAAGLWVLAWAPLASGAQGPQAGDDGADRRPTRMGTAGVRILPVVSVLAVIGLCTVVLPPFRLVEAIAGAPNWENQELAARVAKAVGRAPWVPQLHQFVAESAKRRGDAVTFEKHCRAAIRLEPHFARPEAELGTMFLVTGKYPEAAEHIRRAYALSPHDRAIWKLLGAAEAGVDNFDRAEQIYGNWLALNLSKEERKGVETLAIAAKSLQESVVQLADPKYEERDRLQVYYWRGNAFRDLGLFMRAAEAYSLVPRENVFYYRAQAELRKLNDLVKGAEDARRAGQPRKEESP